MPCTGPPWMRVPGSFSSLFFLLLLATAPARAEEPCSAFEALRQEVPEAVERLLGQPFVSAEDSLQGLRGIQCWLMEDHDQRGLFADVYVQVTEEIESGIRQGLYDDPDWVHRLLVNFANLYREALEHDWHQETDRIPRAWRVSFASSRQNRDPAALQLLLAMNAHISRDMIEALLVSDTDFKSRSRRHDYERINDALSTVAPRAWDALKRWGGGRSLTPKALRQAVVVDWMHQRRDESWDYAERLSRMSPHSREHWERVIDAAVARESAALGHLGLLIR
jgi:hypothetical protein